jgi:hypothetical protein
MLILPKSRLQACKLPQAIKPGVIMLVCGTFLLLAGYWAIIWTAGPLVLPRTLCAR